MHKLCNNRAKTAALCQKHAVGRMLLWIGKWTRRMWQK